jgi:hypothetical protein
MLHAHRTHGGHVQVLSIKQVRALGGHDELHLFARLSKRIKQHACRSRMQRGMGKPVYVLVDKDSKQNQPKILRRQF